MATTSNQHSSSSQQQRRNQNQSYQKNYCGRGTGGAVSSRPICQVYGKTGCTTTICYYFFECGFSNSQNSTGSSNRQTETTDTTDIIATPEHVRDNA